VILFDALSPDQLLT